MVDSAIRPATPPATGPRAAPVARSAIAAPGPVGVRGGWEVSLLTSTAALHLVDLSPMAKVLVRADPGGPVAESLGVGFGRARRDERGGPEVLVVGSGPGEWLLIGAPGTAEALAAGVGGDPGLVTVLDVTHGRALVRLTGQSAPALLAKVCAVDLSERVTPDGAAFRSSVAKLVTDVVRDDVGAQRSYLLHCERSSGQYLFDSLLDAGGDFGIEVAGMPAPETKEN